jgi:16S rRNA (guanine527-N7)-methyltransferase
VGALTEQQIATLLVPYFPAPTPLLLWQLAGYLELLLKWNSRTNLSAVRSPEGIVERHFGESLFMASRLPACRTLLDLGSGAGFPGLPIQLARPDLKVTLAESQHKKSSFLREVVRTLELSTEIWGDRVEAMDPDRRFDVVALRAVDRPIAALCAAKARLAEGGVIAHLTSGRCVDGSCHPVPGKQASFLHIF